ncbi:unnamed protein product [Cladocopium goreaui]|uniref:HAD-IIIC family phosphatase n=1 Tax=Cladocopium goreaui TaxID=2562237 RepID=A0A9P1DH77_9DINO|nr:unnamed protein product [Cladocopium goreaui]
MADPCEIFLGGLPHEPRERLGDLELALRTALEDFAATFTDTENAQVRIRLHSSWRTEGVGLGYGFAWLSSSAAAQLCADGQVQYRLRGDSCTCWVRPARGHKEGRAAPSKVQHDACLEITCFSDLDEALILQAVQRWQTFLDPWKVGIDFCHTAVGVAGAALPPVKAGDGIVVVGLKSGAFPETWRAPLQATKAPVLILAAGEDGDAFDVVSWREVQVDPGAAAAPGALVFYALRRAVAWHLRERLKVFVCDCDQTLWGGVVAEDGLHQLDMTGPFGLLQTKVARLQESGRLVCLASRNDEEDVLRVFSERAISMALKKEQLAAWQIHWGSKATSLRRLASELRLGLEAFVFLDDNPMELESVRQQLPEVITLSIPSDREAFSDLLGRHWALDRWKGSLTAEDTQRTQMYREQVLRKAARQQAPSFEVFLQQLQVRIDLRRPNASEMARVCQLSQRTNQMNSTQLRFANEELLKDWAAGDGRWILAAWVSDRYGDYGLVACAFCSTAAEAALVECLCMSCRVLHRGVEEKLLAKIAAEAEEQSLEQVLIPLLRSPRNDLMLNFLNRVATWAEVAPASEGSLVPVGRHKGRGSLAPAMRLAARKLKDLEGQHTSSELDDAQSTTEGPAAAAVSPAVEWSELLGALDLKVASQDWIPGNCRQSRYELAAAGAPYVVTTSRSGRIAAGQPELVQLQENLRQMCTHYNAKIDGCDIAALTDLFQWMQRPETQAEDVDLFGTCLGTVGKAPALMSSDDVQKLKSTRDHMQETCNLLEEELKNGPSAQHEWQLREMKKKVVKLDEVLGKMNP